MTTTGRYSDAVNSTPNETYLVETVIGHSKPTVAKIIGCTILFVIVIVTMVGNMLVLLAPCVSRKLRNTFTYYILNLAVTDLLVASSAMSFYTFDVLLGYWPFGEVMCGVWIFFDYGMTFASVFTLVAISLDRYWSVQWSIHYRTHNTTRKCMIMLTCVWLAVFAIWTAPCIIDRIHWSEPEFCIWAPSRNPEFVVFIAVIGHHTPCLVILMCYIKVFLVMQKRRKVGPMKKTQMLAPVSEMVSDNAVENTEQRNEGKSSTNCENPDRNKLCVNNEMTMFPSPSEFGTNSTSTVPNLNTYNNQRVKTERREDRETKAFKMLGYILLSYLICWVPFHIVFDISAVNPDIVPEALYTATFWLTYFNSTLNPLVYALTSSTFREAFIQILKCNFKTL